MEEQHSTAPAADADGLVRGHLDLVGQVVSKVAYRFPRHVDREELWNAGALGLVEAASRYDPSMGIPFGRYAAVRIRGAIIDATRTRDWVSRSVRRGLREMDEAASAFAKATGRRPAAAELAAALGIREDEVRTRQAQAASSLLLYLDHSTDGDEPGLCDQIREERAEVHPEDALDRLEMLGTLREAVRELPGVHGDVVRRYYLDGELLQTIADDLGVTEARVSQIRSEALSALRSHFATLYDGVPEVPEASPGKRVRAAYVAALSAQSTWRTRMEAASAGVVQEAEATAG